jgi:hypothetical protein
LLAKPSPLNINLGSDRFSNVQHKAGHPPALAGSVRAGERPIEIRLPNGIVIGVSTAVEVEPLRRVLAALAGR